MLPANTVVRPAVRRVFAAASKAAEPLGELFLEARDHQQRVVDPSAKPIIVLTVSAKPSIEIADESRARTAARGDHRYRPEGERDDRRDRRAEDEQQDEQQDRQGDQLAAVGGVDRFVLDRPRERREAGLRRLDRRRHLFFEDLVQFVDRVADRVAERRRGSRRGPAPCSAPAAGCRLCPCPRARPWSLSGRWPQRVDERRPLFLDRFGGPWSRIAKGAESPKYFSSILLARFASVPGTSSDVGFSLPSTSRPTQPRMTIRARATSRIVRGRRSDNGSRLLPLLTLALLSPTHVARKVRGGERVFLRRR